MIFATYSKRSDIFRRVVHLSTLDTFRARASGSH